MKCENCKYNDCPCRNEDESNNLFECPFESHVIQMPDEWANVRIQAAISAMQAIITNEDLFCRIEEAVNHEGVYEAVAHDSVKMADALVKELKKAQK